MSPRFGTSGYRCARSAQGNASISLKNTGLQPPSGATAALMHSIPLHTVAYVSSPFAVGIYASLKITSKERKSALEPRSFPRPEFFGSLGRNRGRVGHYGTPAGRGVFFRRRPPPWPLTVGVRCGIMSRAGLAGVILGAFSQGFRSPSRPALFSPVFPAGGRRISFAFSAPPKGERRKTKLNRPLPPWVLGLFFVSFSLGKTKLIQPPQEGRN